MNPMMDPNSSMGMIGQQMGMMIPQIFMFSWIQYFFAGCIACMWLCYCIFNVFSENAVFIIEYAEAHDTVVVRS